MKNEVIHANIPFTGPFFITRLWLLCLPYSRVGWMPGRKLLRVKLVWLRTPCRSTRAHFCAVGRGQAEVRSMLRYRQCSATLSPPRGRGGNRAAFWSRCGARRWTGVCFALGLAAEQLPAPWLRWQQSPDAGSYGGGQPGEQGSPFSCSHPLPVAGLARTWHWDHHTMGWGYMVSESCQRAPVLSSQSFDPFMPYALSPTDFRSTDARVRSVLPSGAFRGLSTKW